MTTTQSPSIGLHLPPPILLGLLTKLALLLQFAAFGGMHWSRTSIFAGIAIAIVAQALLAASISAFKHAKKAASPAQQRPSRTPIYLSMAGIAAGVGVALGSVCLAGAAALFALYCYYRR